MYIDLMQFCAIRPLGALAMLVLACGCIGQQDNIRNSVNVLKTIDGVDIVTSYDGDGSAYFQKYDEGVPGSSITTNSVRTVQISATRRALQGFEDHLFHLGSVDCVVLSVASKEDFEFYVEFVQKLQDIRTIVLAPVPSVDEVGLELDRLTSIPEFECLSMLRVKSFTGHSVPALRSTSVLCLAECNVNTEWLSRFMSRNPQLKRLMLIKTEMSDSARNRIIAAYPSVSIDTIE